MMVKTLTIGDFSLREQEIDVNITDVTGYGCVPLVVRWQMARRRMGHAKTKKLSELAGSTAKMRRGSGDRKYRKKRAPNHKGGYSCMGPVVRDFTFSLPKKVIRKAKSFVLKDKMRHNRLVLVEDISSASLGTKFFVAGLKPFNMSKILFVYDDKEDSHNMLLSTKNVKNFKSVVTDAFNVYDTLNAEFLLMDIKSFEKIKDKLL